MADKKEPQFAGTPEEQEAARRKFQKGVPAPGKPIERPLMDFDKGRAKRQMKRPLFGGRR